jgi:ubiquinone/menaquinone biosynthesis C-methylase UbiE
MKAVYDQIGTGYNTTRHADPYIVNQIQELLALTPAMTCLDIGCGTGNYTTAISRIGLEILGIDPSEKMLSEAKAKNPLLNVLVGTAEAIPVANHVFDAILATLTIHHWIDLYKAFSELFRVSKANASVLIFTAEPEQMKTYWLNHYFPEMMQASIKQMPANALLMDAIEKSGFEIKRLQPYHIQNDLQDLFLYSGKNKPRIYFDAEVRTNISSFSLLAHQQEINTGLKQLKSDLKSDHFSLIQKSYQDIIGDYCFMLLQKKGE